jgi:hypothetical protein
MLDASGSGWNNSNTQQYNTSQASCPLNKLVCILMAGAGSQPMRKGGQGRGGRAVVRRSRARTYPRLKQHPPPPPPPPPPPSPPPHPTTADNAALMPMPMPTRLLLRWKKSMSLQLREHGDN